MRSPLPRGRWLKRELLLRLMLPLLAIVATTGALGTYSAQQLTDRVFDRWLLDAASSATALLRFDQGTAHIDLPPQAEAVLLYDDTDRTWLSVVQGERQLAGRTALPIHGERESIYRRGRAFDAVLEGQRVRIARVDVNEGGALVTVLVAETLVKRQRAQQDLVALLWPMGVLVLATAVWIMLAVRRTVLPLEAIAARWNERAHVSLEPIGVDGVPRELMPFASALNDLLARIRAMLARERQFAATAAHQIRTPLTGLQLALDRAREAQDVNTMRRVIEESSEAIGRTARLAQQLLAVGRLGSDTRGDLTFQRIDLVALAQDVGATHVEQGLAKAIEFELVAPPHPVFAWLQRDLMAEALSNLLDNAIRYTSQKGRVLVEFDTNPPAVRIADSGPGIPEEEREAVFERFVRGRAAVGDGSGLGLAIVRDIADLHGATVTLADSVWGGVLVVLTFPSSPESDSIPMRSSR